MVSVAPAAIVSFPHAPPRIRRPGRVRGDGAAHVCEHRRRLNLNRRIRRQPIHARRERERPRRCRRRHHRRAPSAPQLDAAPRNPAEFHDPVEPQPFAARRAQHRRHRNRQPRRPRRRRDDLQRPARKRRRRIIHDAIGRVRRDAVLRVAPHRIAHDEADELGIHERAAGRPALGLQFVKPHLRHRHLRAHRDRHSIQRRRGRRAIRVGIHRERHRVVVLGLVRKRHRTRKRDRPMQPGDGKEQGSDQQESAHGWDYDNSTEVMANEGNGSPGAPREAKLSGCWMLDVGQ